MEVLLKIVIAHGQFEGVLPTPNERDDSLNADAAVESLYGDRS